MKKLLIHNLYTVLSDIHIFSMQEQFVFQVNDEFGDVDDYIDYNLKNGALFDKLSNSDIVFIRLSLSTNYLEYIGIRLAYHIRLSSVLKNKKSMPIVLVGDESYQFLGLTSELSEILFTDGIYLMKDTKEDLERYTRLYADGKLKSLLDPKKFIEKIRIVAPANYSSHHSISNEWSIIRWAEMALNISEEGRQEIYKKNTTKNTLYFKYLEEKYNQSEKHPRQEFKKDKSRENLLVPYKENAKIYFIDDEAEKGWGKLFEEGIFYEFVRNNSFSYYKEIKKGIKKQFQLEKLIEKVKSLIEEDGFNVFIVDLRLFDEDFMTDAIPSGLELIGEIENINKGVQVVVFTASRRAENLQKAKELGVDYYIQKENPENMLSRLESMEVFSKFRTAIKDATKYSRLKDIYSEIKEIKDLALFSSSVDKEQKDFYNATFKRNGLLDKVFDLLKSKNDSLTEFALLACFTALDKFANLFYSSNEFLGQVALFSGTDFCHFRSIGTNINTTIEFKRGNFPYEIEQKGETYISVVFHTTLQSRSQRTPGGGTSGLIMILSVFRYRFEIDDVKLERLMEMKFLRNSLAGHDLGKIDKSMRKVEIEDVVFLLDLLKEVTTIQINKG